MTRYNVLIDGFEVGYLKYPQRLTEKDRSDLSLTIRAALKRNIPSLQICLVGAG